MRHYGERYRVVAPDQRGHGLGGKPVSRYTADELAGDAVALLDHLGIAAVVVVGHSMGAHVAAYLAATHPERVKALALLDKSAAGPEKGISLPPEEIPPVAPSDDEPGPQRAPGRARTTTCTWPTPGSSMVTSTSG